MRLIFLAVLLFPVVARAGDFEAAEKVAVTRVMSSYVSAWLAGDEKGVVELFADDAVLVPHHGLKPVAGLDAIRKWWWPAGAPPTTIDEFVLTHHQVEGSDGMAFVRSSQKLEWTTAGKKFRNAGNAVTILRKSADGRWRIVLQMWGDPPNEPVSP